MFVFVLEQASSAGRTVCSLAKLACGKTHLHLLLLLLHYS